MHLPYVHRHSYTTISDVQRQHTEPTNHEMDPSQSIKPVPMMGEEICMCRRDSIIQEGSKNWTSGLFACFNDLGSCEYILRVTIAVNIDRNKYSSFQYKQYTDYIIQH